MCSASWWCAVLWCRDGSHRWLGETQSVLLCSRIRDDGQPRADPCFRRTERRCLYLVRRAGCTSTPGEMPPRRLNRRYAYTDALSPSPNWVPHPVHRTSSDGCPTRSPVKSCLSGATTACSPVERSSPPTWKPPSVSTGSIIGHHRQCRWRSATPVPGRRRGRFRLQ